jgi:hypothetical protein
MLGCVYLSLFLVVLNDPHGVHISEAGASVISDIILDYVKSPVEGEYTTPNTKKNVSEVQHQPQVEQKNKIWDASLSGTTNRYRIGYEL